MNPLSFLKQWIEYTQIAVAGPGWDGCFQSLDNWSAALCWFVLFSVGFSRSSSVPPEKSKII